MDPLNDFVRARTTDLQRTADDIRRERTLRQTAPAVPTTQALVAPSGTGMTLASVAPVDAATGCDGAGCVPAEQVAA